MKINKRKIDIIAENVMRRVRLNESNESLNQLIDSINTPDGWSLDIEYLVILEYLRDNGFSEDVSQYLSDETGDIMDMFREGTYDKDSSIKTVEVIGFPKTFYIVDMLNEIPSKLYNYVHKEICEPYEFYFNSQKLSYTLSSAIEKHFDDILEDFVDEGLQNGEVTKVIEQILDAKYIDESEEMKLVFVDK